MYFGRDAGRTDPRLGPVRRSRHCHVAVPLVAMEFSELLPRSRLTAAGWPTYRELLSGIETPRAQLMSRPPWLRVFVEGVVIVGKQLQN